VQPRSGAIAAASALDVEGALVGRSNEVDVVVVGAGCVVAARLAGDGSRSVLLLEAGPDLRGKIPDPLRDGWRTNREFDWGYATEPDRAGVVEPLRRGRLVGGTSWVTRFAVRGSPADFDGWLALGNEGWSFDDVLPYFRKLESDADYGDEPWHGAAGPIPIRRYLDAEPVEIHAAALRALEGTGFPSVDDHNRPGAVGAGRMPMSTTDGHRVTTADAYLPLGRTPPNLAIRPDAHVAEVVFEGMRAVGVRLAGGTIVRAGSVVLSAGTYGSPPILMRSGIGPGDHLLSVGIPVRIDLPGVGGNLADHPGVDVDTGYRGPSRAGPNLHSIATFHSALAVGGGPPDLMFWLADPASDPSAFTIDVVLLKPLSRGSVRLRSADPLDRPRIELPGLREASDVDRLVEGYRRGLEVAGRSEVRRLCLDAPPPAAGGAAVDRRVVRENAYSDPHVVGTCAMGRSPDAGAVVDASGRVHGTDGLFVVDASIIPEPPSGFPHVVTIMLAERLAETIALASRAAISKSGYGSAAQEVS
jgi:choline dehydrogenase